LITGAQCPHVYIPFLFFGIDLSSVAVFPELLDYRNILGD